MLIPEGMTEQEVINIIEEIANRLCNKFKFGYYTAEDIKQQAFIEGINGLERYQISQGPLINFLSVHIKNRLHNFKRDNYLRHNSPCNKCIVGIEGKTKHRNKKLCNKYLQWQARNKLRQNLMNTIDIHILNEEHHNNFKKEHDIENKELLDKIDEHLPLDMRKDFLKMKDGITISNIKRQEILDKIKEILGEDFCG